MVHYNDTLQYRKMQLRPHIFISFEFPAAHWIVAHIAEEWLDFFSSLTFPEKNDDENIILDFPPLCSFELTIIHALHTDRVCSEASYHLGRLHVRNNEVRSLFGLGNNALS